MGSAVVHPLGAAMTTGKRVVIGPKQDQRIPIVLEP